MTNRSHAAHTRSSAQRGDTVTWVGNSCGRHGSYIFYKAFRFRISSEFRQTISTSRAIMRSRSRDRRNNQCEGDRNSSDNDTSEAKNREVFPDERIIALGEFFYVQCRPEDPVCVGELQLLWHDKHSGQDLASTRLYYLPETTPAGRLPHHGEDEVLAVSEKIVMRTIDLSSWIVEPDHWNYGSSLPPVPDSSNGCCFQPTKTPLHRYSLLRACVNMSDVKQERQALTSVNGFCSKHTCNPINLKKEEEQPTGESNSKSPNDLYSKTESSQQCARCTTDSSKAKVLLLGLTAYCRHKAILKRIEGAGKDWMTRPGAGRALAAMGVYTSDNPRTRLVFCRETFDYPQLFEHDLICEELAPVFKGRPRKKTKKPNSIAAGKNQVKKPNTSQGSRSGVPITQSCAFSVSVKVDNYDQTSGRRSSSRRKSKRKSPQKSSYEDQFAPVLIRSVKRLRRGPARTPTPVGEAPPEKPVSSSKSEPTSPAAEQSNSSSSSTVCDVTYPSKSSIAPKRKSKRRQGQRTSPLSIALKNSLLENHRVKSPENRPQDREENSKPPLERSNSSSSSASSGSSRSDSPPSDLQDNLNKVPSPTESVSSNSNDPYGQLSPSPLDFLDIMSAADDTNLSKDVEISTSEENMHLRRLSEGILPENKSSFLEVLHQFMLKRNTPIGRIPSLGFKKLDLWAFFKLSQEFGGYEMITAKRLWKHVYDRMGGNPSCTSAATCTRKHFEKLLLPLENYLRNTLRKRESETLKSKSENEDLTKSKQLEDVSNHSPLNGRTFNGDAYFHNGAKVTNPTSSPDAHKATATPESKSDHHTPSPSSPTELSPLTKTPPTSIVNLKSSCSTSRPIINRSAAIITAAPLMNFESYVHSVIKGEILANKKQTEMQQNDTKKVSKQSSKPLQNNEVIDLTGSGSEKTISSAVHTPCPSTNSNISSIPCSKLSTPPITFSPRPSTASVFSRTHCPRMSMPPPYVPKPSAPKFVVQERPSKRTTHEAAYPLQDKRSSDKASEDFGRLKVQKRPFSDEREHLRAIPSSTSPKRLRPNSLLTTPSPSNRVYDVQNLVSTDSKSGVLAQHKEIHRGEKVHPAYEVSKVPEIRKREAFESHPNHKQPVDNRFHHLAHRERDPVYSGRGSVIVPSQGGEKITQRRGMPPAPIVTKRTPSPPRKVMYSAAERIHNKEKSYYRPAGMLATYREAAKNQTSRTNVTLPNGVVKLENIAEKYVKSEAHAMHRPDVVVVNAAPRSFPSSSKDQLISNHSPKMALQRAKDPPSREPFSSSFSVDRLTSSDSKRLPLHNGAQAHVTKQERKTPNIPFSSAPATKSYTFHPGYPGTHNPPYRPRAEKDNLRTLQSSASSVTSQRDEATLRQDRARFELLKESRELLSRPHNPSLKVSTSGADKSTGAVSSQSTRDKVIPATSHALPFLPQHCTPAHLEQLLPHSFKSIAVTLSSGGVVLPQVAALPMARAQAPVMHDALLRRQMTEFVAQQEQAAAANQIALLTGHNPIPGADPALVAAYAAAYASQLSAFQHARPFPEPSGASGAAVSNKHAADSELLTQLARMGGGQLDLRNPGLLVAAPQLPPRVTRDAAAALAYSYPRR